MTKRSSPFRMKVLRKIGVSLWPWRHMTLKQVEKLDKIVQKQSKQTLLLERKNKCSPLKKVKEESPNCSKIEVNYFRETS